MYEMNLRESNPNIFTFIKLTSPQEYKVLKQIVLSKTSSRVGGQGLMNT